MNNARFLTRRWSHVVSAFIGARIARMAAALFIMIALIALPTSIGAVWHASLSADSAQEGNVVVLKLGASIDRPLTRGNIDTYQITLETGSYLEIAIDAKGMDLKFKLLGPDNKPMLQMSLISDALNAPISLVAKQAGHHRIEITPDTGCSPGSYRLIVTQIHRASSRDQSQAAALAAFAEAEELRARQTVDARRQAIQKYEEAGKIWRTLSDYQSEAHALSESAGLHIDLGDNREAVDLINRLLPQFRSSGERKAEAQALDRLGNAQFPLSGPKAALQSYNDAFSIRHAIGDCRGEAGSLNDLALANFALGDSPKALEQMNQSLSLRRAANDYRGEAQTLSNTGMVYDASGEKQKALDFYSQALPMRRIAGDLGGEAATLNLMGLLYFTWVELDKATDCFERAVSLSRAIGDRTKEARALAQLGLIYNRQYQMQKAIEALNQALSLSRATGDRRLEAFILGSIGSLYAGMGDQRIAINYLERAIALWRESGDSRGEAVGLNQLGLAYYGFGERERALESYLQILPINRKLHDRRGEAGTLNNMGFAYAALGNSKQALDSYVQALPLFRAVGDKSGEATSLDGMGNIYALSDAKTALEYYDQARAIQRDTRNLAGEARVLYDMARLERSRGNLDAAQPLIEDSVNAIEYFRGQVASEDLRTSFAATTQERYEFYIDLLMQRHAQHSSDGYDSRAFEVNERSKGRTLLDMLGDLVSDIHGGVDPKMLDRERSISRLLRAQLDRQARLLGSRHTDEQAAVIQREIDDLTTQYHEVRGAMRTSSPHHAALTQPQPLTVKEIQSQMLDDDSLLLEYALGDQHSYLWAVTTTSIAGFELPKRQIIEAAAGRLYDALRSGLPSGEAASELGAILLRPVAGQLGKKRLLIVSNGALQYIPFSALPEPPPDKAGTAERTPLMVTHEIVVLPSASTTAVLRRELASRPAPQKILAVLADAVYETSDPRVRRAAAVEKALPGLGPSETPQRTKEAETVRECGSVFQRLPFSRREGQAISALVRRTEVYEAYDFSASVQSMQDPRLRQYKYIHVASHSCVNKEHPQLSGVVLSLVDSKGQSQEGFLRLPEIYNLKLGADLVVLSACETGLGKEIKGEGLIGLTRGFMYAGSPRVVVSLWNVNDLATAELMKLFYRGMLVEHRTPAAALRVAQIAMWKQRRWQSAYYWAPFVIQGEPK